MAATRWAGHRARWRGDEHAAVLAATEDGVWVRLQRSTPAEGFQEVAPDRWVRAVPAAECDVVVAVATVGTWRGHPVLVLDDRAGDLLVEATGGSWPTARLAGFDRVERGVWRRWAPREEVRGVREDTTVLDLGAQPPVS